MGLPVGGPARAAAVSSPWERMAPLGICPPKLVSVPGRQGGSEARSQTRRTTQAPDSATQLAWRTAVGPDVRQGRSHPNPERQGRARMSSDTNPGGDDEVSRGSITCPGRQPGPPNQIAILPARARVQQHLGAAVEVEEVWICLPLCRISQPCAFQGDSVGHPSLARELGNNACDDALSMRIPFCVLRTDYLGTE